MDDARPRGPKVRQLDVVRVRSLYLDGGLSFERVALIVGRESGRSVSAATVRARYLEAGYPLRDRPAASRVGDIR